MLSSSCCLADGLNSSPLHTASYRDKNAEVSMTAAHAFLLDSWRFRAGSFVLSAGTLSRFVADNQGFQTEATE